MAPPQNSDQSPQSSTAITAGDVVISASFRGVTSRIGQFVLREMDSPDDQVWFVDGRSTIWGLPEAATVTTAFVPMDEHHRLRSSGIQTDGIGLPPVENELSPAVDELLIELVGRGVAVHASFRGTLTDSRSTLSDDVPVLSGLMSEGTEEWLVQFLRAPTEWVHMTVTGAGAGAQVAVSHAFATVLSTDGEDLGERWLDLSAAAAGCGPTDVAGLAEMLLTVPLSGDRWDDPEPSPPAAENTTPEHTIDGSLTAGLIAATRGIGTGSGSATEAPAGDHGPDPDGSIAEDLAVDGGL